MQTNTVIIGVDPGLKGAVAVISHEKYDVYDIPVIGVQKTTKIKTMVDLQKLEELIKDIKEKYSYSEEQAIQFEAWVEDVHAMPMQGVCSMFSMGRTLGNIEMILTAFDIPINWVSPQKWKKEVIFGAGSDKLISIDKAKELFPKCELETKRGRLLDGRSEALLIAEYGRRQCLK